MYARLFVLKDRVSDGVVAEGCEFSDGQAAVRWYEESSTAVFDSVDQILETKRGTKLRVSYVVS